MTRIWLVDWRFQSRITLWCRHKSTNVSMELCWQMPEFIVWRLWCIYFDHHLPLKPSIGKRRKQSCTPIIYIYIYIYIYMYVCVYACADTCVGRYHGTQLAERITQLFAVRNVGVYLLVWGNQQLCGRCFAYWCLRARVHTSDESRMQYASTYVFSMQWRHRVSRYCLMALDENSRRRQRKLYSWLLVVALYIYI